MAGQLTIRPAERRDAAELAILVNVASHGFASWFWYGAVLDGSLGGWLAWLEQAMQEDYARVVPGHGPLDQHWPDGAAALYRYLRVLRDDTRAAIAAGALVEDAQQSVAAGELGHWQLTGRAHALNVSRAFRELEWE